MSQLDAQRYMTDRSRNRWNRSGRLEAKSSTIDRALMSRYRRLGSFIIQAEIYETPRLARYKRGKIKLTSPLISDRGASQISWCIVEPLPQLTPLLWPSRYGIVLDSQSPARRAVAMG